MSKQQRQGATAEQVFNDLEAYLDFCREYGYRYNEADLYNNKKYPFQQFRKFQQGRSAKNMWDIDKHKAPKVQRG